MWVLCFVHAALCDVSFTSAGAHRSVRGEAGDTVFTRLTLVREGEEKSAAGGSATLMDRPTCAGLGRLLTAWLRNTDFYYPFLC